MINWMRTYIKFVLLHKWNRVREDKLKMLDDHWQYKPTKGLRLWLYNKVKKINGGDTQ